MSNTIAVLVISLLSLHRSLRCFKTRTGDVWVMSKVEEVVLGGSVSSDWLFAYRIVMFVFATIFTLVHLAVKGLRPMRFYTKWNFYSLTLYFGLVVWETLWFRRRKATDREHPFGMGAYMAIILYHINMTTVWTVDVGTWGVLYPLYRKHPEALQQFLLNFFSYVEHILNLFMMIGELMMNRMPFFDHLRGTVGLWVVSYVFYGFFYRLQTGLWVYPVSKTTEIWSPFVYACIFTGHFLAFRLFHLFHRVKTNMLLETERTKPLKMA